MNKIDEVVAGLEPAVLNRAAEDAYARNRHDDLARAAADGSRPKTTRPRGRGAAVLRNGRWLPLAGAVVAVGAAAAVAVAVALPAGPPPARHQASSRPAGAGRHVPAGHPAPPVTTRGFLLSSARVAALAPATTGTYWYVKQRDFYFAYPKGPVKLSYTVAAAANEESWTGPNQTRTIVNEDLAFVFASPADKARWEAAGSPKLANPAGGFGYTGPRVSNYNFGGYTFNEGNIQVSMATAGKLPTTAAGLGRLLRGQFDKLSPEQQAQINGLPHARFTGYLFLWAEGLLTGPITPGTTAAVYQLLADQPGLTVAPNVTDPLGRAGTAIGNGDHDYLIIDPVTAKVLDIAFSMSQPRPGSVISGSAGSTEAYMNMCRANQLGVVPQTAGCQ